MMARGREGPGKRAEKYPREHCNKAQNAPEGGTVNDVGVTVSM